MFDLPVECKTCGQQYTGNTTDHFRSRWNSHKSDVRKVESGNMENVKQNFLQSYNQGFLDDVELRLTNKMQNSDPPKWKYYWMRTLGTLYLIALILKMIISSLLQHFSSFAYLAA